MQLSDISFRTANENDIQALIKLVTSAYRGEISRLGWTTEADILDGQRIDAQGINDDLLRPNSVILLAEYQHQLLACCHLAKEGDHGYFGMFAVRPHLQGKGIGKYIMQSAENYVYNHWQLSCLQMSVIDCRDDLISFYQRRGYRRTGIKKPFPYGDERFGIPRRPDLQFEILEKSLMVSDWVG